MAEVLQSRHEVLDRERTMPWLSHAMGLLDGFRGGGGGILE